MGLPVIILPKFELEKACQAIQEFGITFASIPPPVVLALAKHPAVAKYDLSTIKFVHSGAAPLGRDLVEMVWDRLTIPVMQGYGLSETSPGLAKGVVFDWKRYNGSAGKLLPNIVAKVVDLEGSELPAGKEGELWVKGPNVFSGYLNRPELQKDTFSADGYFRTGDIGYFDEKGNLYITDRLKELIKYSEYCILFSISPFFNLVMPEDERKRYPRNRPKANEASIEPQLLTRVKQRAFKWHPRSSKASCKATTISPTLV